MLAAIAEGDTRLENFSTGADCASTLGCVRALGVEVERTGNSVVIHGRGQKLQAPKTPLDCGNSGSTMRMLSGILAGQDFETLKKLKYAARVLLSRSGEAETIDLHGRPTVIMHGGKGPPFVYLHSTLGEAVRWLIEQRSIGALGIDTMGIDPGADTSFGANRLLLAEHRIHLENLAGLGEMPPSGGWIIVGGIRIRGGSGSPATVFGLIP